jgi:FkbM family methyltransferase
VLRILRKYFYYLASIFKLLFGFDDPFLIAGIYLNPARLGVKTVRLRRSGLRFKVRGAMDVWSIKETFLDRFYEKYGFIVQPNWNIVDIGAGIGDYALFTAVAQLNSRVFSYEPYPESFSLLQENLSLNTVTNVRVFHDAVGAESGELVLDLAGGEPLQFQSHLKQAVQTEKSMTVNSIPLVDVLAGLEQGSCDLLKLDCEGAEYPILFNAPHSALARIRHIVMEYHDSVSPHTHHDLTAFLEEQGFEVETFANPVHAHLGYLRAQRKNMKGDL